MSKPDKNVISEHLNTVLFGRELICLSECASTNDEVLLAMRRGAAFGTTVVSDVQTKGRGRRSRGWVTPEGSAIAMSVGLHPGAVGELGLKRPLDSEAIPRITLVAAIAVADAIGQCLLHETGGFREKGADDENKVMIKWPNDIVIGKKKICGILTENRIEPDGRQFIIVGIGVNVTVSDFPEEIAGMAGSIRTQTGCDVNRDILIAEILNCFEDRFRLFAGKGNLSDFVDKYNKMLINCGKTVRIMEPEQETDGVARGIDETGALLVETGDGVRRVESGEVSVRGVYGYV